MKRRNFLATLFAAPLAAKAIPEEKSVLIIGGGERGNPVDPNEIIHNQWVGCFKQDALHIKQLPPDRIVTLGDSVCHGYSDTKELNIPINRVVQWENNKLVEL